ncbi:MAG: hypothetical protein WC389_16170 [Lutibacter sp.]|jgi:hypothetical protein
MKILNLYAGIGGNRKLWGNNLEITAVEWELQNFFKGKYVVENVKSYYDPLIKPQESGRHYFWSNFRIPFLKMDKQIGRMNVKSKILKNMGYIQRCG